MFNKGSGVLVLGPVTLRAEDGSTIDVAGTIPRLLLSRLALADGRAVPDDQCIDGIWGEELPSTAETALRVHMSRLRRLVRQAGSDVVRRHHGYALDPALRALDASTLDDLERTIASSSDERAIAACEQAIELWRGPSLADVRRLPYGDRAAVEFDRRRTLIEERRQALLVDAGRGREVVLSLQHAVTANPLHEGAWALLARALHQDGRTTEALRTIGLARRQLLDVAGLAPGAELVALERDLLTVTDDEPAGSSTSDDDPATSTSDSSGDPTRLPPSLRVLAGRGIVERDGQLSAVSEAIARAAAGECSTIVRLLGAAGVGKSALAAAAALRSANEGIPVLHTWCEEQLSFPLQPFEQLLGRNLRVNRGSVESDHASERGRIVAAVRQQLVQLAQRRAMLLVIDDLHWADELTLAVLHSLDRHPAPAALAVLVTERPRMGAAPFKHAVEIKVPPLSAAGVAALLSDHCTRDEAEAIILATEGLPLLVETAVASLVAGRPWEPRVGLAILNGQAADIGSTSMHTLRIAAALGTAFSFGDLLNLAERTTLGLLEDLEDSMRSGLVRLDESRPAVYCFAHHLVPEALLEPLAPQHRARLHLHIADVLADAMTPAERLWRLRLAGDLAEREALVSATIAAADDLIAACAFETARAEITATLATTGGLDSGRAGLLSRRGRASAALREPAAALRDFEDALQAAIDSNDVPAQVDVTLAREVLGYRFAPSKHDLDRITVLLERLPVGDNERRFELSRHLALRHLNAGHLDAAQVALKAAADLEDTLEGGRRGDLVSLEHWLCESRGDVEGRRLLVESARHIHPSGGVTRLRALGIELVEACHAGDRDLADRLASDIRVEARRCGDVYAEWLGAVAKFTTPFLDGDFARSLRAASDALQFGRDAGIVGADDTWATQEYAVRWLTDDLESFVDKLRDLRVEAPDLAWRGALALALASTERADEAAKVLDTVGPSIDAASMHWLGFVGLALTAEAAATVGNTGVLAKVERLLRTRAEDHVVLGWGALDYGPVARYRALALAALDAAREAEQLQRAVISNHEAGRIWRARAAMDLARAHSR